MTMNRIEVITTVERRRRWSGADKARLVAAMDEPGAVVTEVARSAGVDASLLYRWRRELGGERDTVIETCRLNDVDPRAWLAEILAKLPDHPAHRVAELAPWAWKARRDDAARAAAAVAA